MQLPNPEVTVRAGYPRFRLSASALSVRLPGAGSAGPLTLNLADGAATWYLSCSGFDVVINTVAYTAVDKAGTAGAGIIPNGGRANRPHDLRRALASAVIALTTSGEASETPPTTSPTPSIRHLSTAPEN
jgi:hypothetical protein